MVVCLAFDAAHAIEYIDIIFSSNFHTCLQTTLRIESDRFILLESCSRNVILECRWGALLHPSRSAETRIEMRLNTPSDPRSPEPSSELIFLSFATAYACSGAWAALQHRSRTLSSPLKVGGRNGGSRGQRNSASPSRVSSSRTAPRRTASPNQWKSAPVISPDRVRGVGVDSSDGRGSESRVHRLRPGWNNSTRITSQVVEEGMARERARSRRERLNALISGGYDDGHTYVKSNEEIHSMDGQWQSVSARSHSTAPWKRAAHIDEHRNGVVSTTPIEIPLRGFASQRHGHPGWTDTGRYEPSAPPPVWTDSLTSTGKSREIFERREQIHKKSSNPRSSSVDGPSQHRSYNFNETWDHSTSTAVRCSDANDEIPNSSSGEVRGERYYPEDDFPHVHAASTTPGDTLGQPNLSSVTGNANLLYRIQSAIQEEDAIRSRALRQLEEEREEEERSLARVRRRRDEELLELRRKMETDATETILQEAKDKARQQLTAVDRHSIPSGLGRDHASREREDDIERRLAALLREESSAPKPKSPRSARFPPPPGNGNAPPLTLALEQTRLPPPQSRIAPPAVPPPSAAAIATTNGNVEALPAQLSPDGIPKERYDATENVVHALETSADQETHVSSQPQVVERLHQSNPSQEEKKPTIETTQVGNDLPTSKEEVVKDSAKGKDSAKPSTGSSRTLEDWKEIWEPKRGKFYYSNTKTKKTQWSSKGTSFEGKEGTPPDVDTQAASSDASQPITKTTNEKVDKTEESQATATETKKVEKSEKSKNESKQNEEDLDALVEKALKEKTWTKRVDPKSGKTFFYNPKTKQTTWDLKKELGKELKRKS